MPNRIIQYPVPLMLRKILKDQSSGELVVAGKNFTKNLYFVQGILTFAKTTVIEERLGEILFKLGKIDKPQFMDISRLIKQHKERLGKILTQENILSQRDLFFALIFQLRTIATSTFQLTAGEWHFIPTIPKLPEDSNFSIQLPGVITEGANKMGSISYYKNKFYYKSPKLATLSRTTNDVLSSQDMGFYKELNQFNNTPLHQIMPAMKMSEDVFWKKIAMLFLLNLLEFSDVSIDKEKDKNIEEVVRLYEQLKQGRMDYYQILGLTNSTNFSEIKGTYFQLAKKYHPDRLSSAPDPEIKEKANFVFAEINKAYETLSNDDRKREYDTKGYKENSQDTIQENLSEKARLLYRKAKSLYNQKKFWEAATTLDEVVSLDKTKASYYLLLGMCQMNLPALRRMAADNLQKAIDLEHWNIEAYTAMGILFISESQPKRAENFFRKALSIDPDHALARKKLMQVTGTVSNSSKKKGKFSIFGKSKK